MYTYTLPRLWLYFTMHLILHILQVHFKGICKVECFSNFLKTVAEPKLVRSPHTQK